MGSPDFAVPSLNALVEAGHEVICAYCQPPRPAGRGAAPIQRAILAGDDVSGVTIMRMDEGLDTGPMLLKRELDIRGRNAGQVTEELAKVGASALIEWLADPTPPEPQPDTGETYA